MEDHGNAEFREWSSTAAANCSNLLETLDALEIHRDEAESGAVEARLCKALDDASVGVAILDENTTIVHVNKGFRKISGFAPRELIGKRFESLVISADRSALETLRIEVQQKGQPVVEELRCRHKDGSVRWVRHNLANWPRPDLLTARFLVLSEDVTERRKIEASLREREHYFRSLTLNTTDIIGILDADGRIRYQSPTVTPVLGFLPEDLVGRCAFDLIHPDEAELVKRQFRTLVKSGSSSGRLQFRFQHLDGTWRYLDGVTTNLLADAAVGGIVTTCRDVTERMETERCLQAAVKAAKEATDAKSRFLANMSHEIRTPLNGVIGLCTLLLDTELNEEQSDYAEGIRFSAETLLSLVSDILDLSKMEADRLELENEPFAVRSMALLMAEVALVQCRPKNVDLRVNLGDDVPSDVRGDGFRLRQVLNNLLSNAIKFTTAGHIELSITVYDRTPAKIGLRFEVSDTGIGISEEKIGKLFQSFTQVDASTTRKFGGTGLGLAISKEIVERMRGQIGVQSVPGQGSTFWLEIGFDRASPVKKPEAPILLRGSSEGRVLVAEDNTINTRIARAMLEKAGYSVDTVGDGLHAIAAVQRGNYDLVLMDVHMPHTDGMEATRAIRALQSAVSSIPIVAMTANAMPGDKERCLDAGMDGYLSKPIRQDEMLDVVKVQIERRASIEVQRVAEPDSRPDLGGDIFDERKMVPV